MPNSSASLPAIRRMLSMRVSSFMEYESGGKLFAEHFVHGCRLGVEIDVGASASNQIERRTGQVARRIACAARHCRDGVFRSRQLCNRLEPSRRGCRRKYLVDRTVEKF